MLESLIMAGEIDEPRSLSFRANSLHSGSISFGRYEAESLSWERRSSFSHNRYLEEVEKYSKPGSVTEKKAYFEAHFRRKALLSQSSSECQGGMDYQTSENNTTENMGYSEEFEHINDGYHSVQFDKSSAGSEYDGYCEVDCDRDDMGTPYVDLVFEPALTDACVVRQSVSENVIPENEHQTQTESLPVIHAEPGKEVKEGLNGETVNVDLTNKSMHLATATVKDDISCLEYEQESSLKVGSKLIKDKPQSPVNVTGVQSTISSEPSQGAAKIAEREGSRSTKTEKQSSQTAALMIRSVHRTSKTEDSKSSKLEVIHNNGRGKELKSKKVAEPKPSVSEKAATKARQIANRPKKAENSTKPGMKQSSVVFSFKSDERAERRKQFYLKLEEKMHAKEAEMNQIQAKKLEKTENEYKQFRKSLNFRATPMPSFYHEAVQRDSDKNQAVSSNTKSVKLRSRSTPGCGSARRSPSQTKGGNDQAAHLNASVNAGDPPQDSVVSNCSLTSVSSDTGATSWTHSTNRRIVLKDHRKENNTNLPKHRVSGSSKVPKGQRFEGNHKVELGRSNNRQ